MTAIPDSSRKSRIRYFTVGIVILLWFVYTVLQTVFVIGDISETWSAILGFGPGLLGLAALWAGGLSRQDCFLVIRPLSWKGFVVLAAVFVFALAAVLPFGTWEGWNWKAALIYAPARGISQELFFRAVLFPAIILIMKKRPGLALIIHSVLFGSWHIGPLFVGAPVWAVFAVMFVPFLCGIGWGWQVQHDKTVLWAMIQHSLIWVVGMQFPITV
jgi:membrane protease YdiL (CAAX protease family)